MFGKKQQIIKCDARAYQLFPGESEPIFIRIQPKIVDLKAQIEVPANYHVFIKKSGEYSSPLHAGVSDIFTDKEELKNFKKGHSLDILFAKKDKEVSANWVVDGDSTTIFEDKDTKELIKFNRCNGSFVVKVKDPTLFHRKVVDDKDVYRVDDLEKDALNTIKSAFIDCFFNAIEEDDIDFSSIVRHRARIAELVCTRLNKKIESKGFEFEAFDIDRLDLDYQNVRTLKSVKNGNDDILRKKEKEDRAVHVEDEERRFRHEEKMAENLFQASPKKDIKVVICKVCGKENPTDADRCVFCHARLN